MGDRPDQAPRQHQPAAGCRARRRVGCVHRFARATCRTKWNQSADGARFPQARGRRKSARILPRPNRALGRRSTRFLTPNSGRCGWDALEAKLACQDTEGKLEMKKDQRGINPASKPSGDGCVECLASPKGWWFHLRRCAKCGHIGCCDSSPSQHASKHAATTGHPIIASFEPGEDWFYDYEKRGMIKGVELLPPHSHPEDQPSPGPAGRVPANWESLLH